MQNKPNKIKWKIGDIVIHDSDEKIPHFLMIITDIERSDKLYKTKYLNRRGFELYYLNHRDFLLDPALFGIDVVTQKKDKKQEQRTLDSDIHDC